MEWLHNLDESQRLEEAEAEREKMPDSVLKGVMEECGISPARSAAPAPRPQPNPQIPTREPEANGRVPTHSTTGPREKTEFCFYHACKVLDKHPKWPLRGKGYSCSRGEACRYKHGKISIQDGLQLLKDERFPNGEDGQPRPPRVAMPRSPKQDSPGGQDAARQNSAERIPKHCKTFLKTGKCTGGRGCPGEKFHFTKEQLQKKMDGETPAGGGREPSPHPNKLETK